MLHVTAEGAITQTTAKMGPWQRKLVIYVRVLAALALIKALIHWSYIAGVGDGPSAHFLSMPMGWRIATVYFAVFDPLAAIGLWLAAPWGGILWLLTAGSMIMVEGLLPEIYGGRIGVIVILLAQIGLYGFLRWRTYQEEQAQEF